MRISIWSRRAAAMLMLGFAMLVGCCLNARAQSDQLNLEENLPVQVEDAYATAYRNREVQFFTRYERQRDGSDRVTIAPRLEVGLFRNTQVTVESEFLTGSGDNTTSGDIRVSGLYNFNTEGLRLPAFALAGSVTAPSGQGSAGVDFSSKFIATKTISKRDNVDRLHLNLKYLRNNGRRIDERSDRYRAILGYSARISGESVFVADFVRQSERIRGENSNVVEAGVRYQFNPLTVLSFGGGAGIGEQSPRFRVTFGIQRSLKFFSLPF